VSSAVRDFQPNSLDRYVIVQRYSSVFLEPGEAEALKRDTKRSYYQVLAHAALRFREKAFWRYHEKGLKTLGENIDWLYLVFLAGCELLWRALNPGSTVARVLGYSKREMKPGQVA
jgi:hypothetical protein